MRSLLFLAGIGLVGYGGYQYYRTQTALLSKTDVSLSGVKIVERSLNKVTIRFTIDLVNKSEQEFILRKYDLKVMMNGKYLGDIKNTGMNTLVKGLGGKTSITSDFTFNPKTVGIEDMLTLISRGRSSQIRIFGTVSARKGIILVDAPIDTTYTLAELL